MSNANKSIKFLTIVFMGLIWSGMLANQDTRSSDKIYVGFVIYAMVFIITFSIIARKLIITDYMKNVIPLIFVFVWIYGMIRGLAEQNNPQYVYRNFSGMVFYLFYYFFSACKFDKRALLKTLYLISILTSTLTVVMYVDCFMIGSRVSARIPLLSNSVYIEQQSIKLPTREMIYISFAVALFILLNENTRIIKNLSIIIIDVIAVFVCVKQAGDDLAIVVIGAAVFGVSFFSNPNKKTVIAAFVAVFAMVFYFITVENNPFIRWFSVVESGNAVRYLQIEYILSDLKLFGHGLGELYPSNLYIASVSAGYSVEVIYFDLIYKLGIMAVFVFGVYVYTIKQSIHVFARYKNANSVVPLACMAYMIPAVGNPMLFSPSSIMLHIIVMYLLRNDQLFFSMEGIFGD